MKRKLRKYSQTAENIERRRRYAEDSAYRESRLAQGRPWKERVKKDPELRAEYNKRAREWAAKNRETMRLAAKRWRANNRELSREIVKRNHRKIRNAFIDAYGGCCACCGEKERVFLTIEHRRNDGKEKLKKHKSDIAILRDLRDRGWPKDEGIEVYCWNCNTAVRFGRICPHQLRKQFDQTSSLGTREKGSPEGPAQI